MIKKEFRGYVPVDDPSFVPSNWQQFYARRRNGYADFLETVEKFVAGEQREHNSIPKQFRLGRDEDEDQQGAGGGGKESAKDKTDRKKKGEKAAEKPPAAT